MFESLRDVSIKYVARQNSTIFHFTLLTFNLSETNMPRVKRGVMAAKKKRKLREYTKGFKFGRNSKVTRMTEATMHAFTYMFAHRRKKKGDFRTLWNIKINAGARANGLPYNTLIHRLKEHNILLDRKILAGLAATHPTIFTKLVAAIK